MRALLVESAPEDAAKIYMDGLHPHALGDETVLGCARGIAQFVMQDRYQREIRRILGVKKLTLVDCQCEPSREQAA
jgi:hypothetical protein